MQTHLYIVLLLISLIIPVHQAVNSGSKSSDTHLDGESQYSEQTCSTKVECHPCNFDDMKNIRECMIHGDIRTETCERVNKINKEDKRTYEIHHPCHGGGVGDYTVYFFSFCIIIGLAGFLVILLKYRNLLELMIYEEWIESIHQKDGMSSEKEQQMRSEAVNFMTSYGIFFNLPNLSIAKGIVIFHQISKQVSFKKFDRLLYGAVCVFLASKLDDYPRSIKEYIRVYDYMHTIHTKQMNLQKGISTSKISFNEISPEGFQAHVIESKRQTELDEKFCIAEIEILKLNGYDFTIELPYEYLNIIKRSPVIPDAQFLRVANNFINDSFKTTICLYYEPRIIALAGLKLASEFTLMQLGKFEEDKPWYKCFGNDIEMGIIDEVINLIKDLYRIKATAE